MALFNGSRFRHSLLVLVGIMFLTGGVFAQQKTLTIYIPWGVERTEGTDPMANAFRAWRDQVAAKKFPGIKVEVIGRPKHI